MYPQKESHLSVQRSFVHNSPQLETTRCPLTDECINTVWPVHATEYFSAPKRSKLWTRAMSEPQKHAK